MDAETSLVVAYMVHDDVEFMKPSLQSFAKAGPIRAYVSKAPWHGSPGNWEAAVAIAEELGAVVVLGEWRSEAEHRRFVLDDLRQLGVEFALLPDTDEVIEPCLLDTLIKYAENDLADRVYVEIDTYWKRPDLVIRPREPFTPLMLVAVNRVHHIHLRQYDGGRDMLLNARYGVVHHLAYAGTDARIKRKIGSWSHRNDSLTTQYEYDAAGQQTVIIDPLAGRTTMAYTNEGWQRAIQNPLGRRTTWSYDRAGRPVTVIDPLGQVRTNTYDVLGRIVSIQSANAERVTMQYDALSRLTTMQDASGTTTQVWSARSELLDQTLPGGLQLQMGYDPVGNRTTLIDPDGGAFVSSFDALNRLSDMLNPAGRRFTHQYDAASRLTTLLSSNGWKRKWQYDNASQLTTLIDLNSSNNPVSTMVDTWDPGGRKTKSVRDGAVSTYAMDTAGRLIRQEESGRWATFAYDGLGNMTLKHHQGSSPITMNYDAGSQLTTIQDGPTLVTITYDLNGNMTSEDRAGVVTQWQYDPENRLRVEIRPDSTRATYTYQPDGLRRTKLEPGGSLTTFVWDGSDYLQERS